jgi:hypothetical protein
MSETVEVERSRSAQRWEIGCARVGEPQPRRAVFRLTVTNTSDALVRRWAMSFVLPAGTHARGEGVEFDIAPEASAAAGRPGLFEVECLGDVYVCAATWDLAPGAQAAVRVTVHGPNGLALSSSSSSGPQGLSVLS